MYALLRSKVLILSGQFEFLINLIMKPLGTNSHVQSLWYRLLVVYRRYNNDERYQNRLMTKQAMWLCAKQRLRSAWASAQSDQSLRCALNG